MAHLCVALPNLKLEQYPGDMLGPSYHEERIVNAPIDIQGPVVTISDRPGLGVDVNWAKVERLVLKT